MIHNGIETPLKRGDKITWHTSDNTISFERGTDRMRRSDQNDDKYLAYLRDRMSFGEIAALVANAAGLTAQLDSSSERREVYAFM